MVMARPNVRYPPSVPVEDNFGSEDFERLVGYISLPSLKVHEALPTYEQATSRRRWDLIASHITDTNDLHAACLVSKELRSACMPHLWGSPAQHFGSNGSARYRALRAFFECAELASLETRLLVHTLDLIKIETYQRSDSFNVYRLPILFNILPNLQVLQITRPCTLVERSVLAAIWSASQSSLNLIPIPWNQRYGLRMLTLRGVKNIEPQTLGAALKLFRNLMYLDLTETEAAGTEALIRVIASKTRFPHLQVLKLRKVGLVNERFFSILMGLSRQLWSLDVRDNCLTDDNLLGGILVHCFASPSRALPSYHSLSTDSYELTQTVDSLLELLPFNDRTKCSHTDHRMKNVLGVDSEPYLRRIFGQVPAINTGPELHNGLTHLYIANNGFTIKSIMQFIWTGRLRVFDAGTVLSGDQTRPEIDPKHKQPGDNFWAAETYNFFTHFNEKSQGSLCALRMNHHMMTGDAELFDDGIVPGPDTRLADFPVWAPDSLQKTDSYHSMILEDRIAELVGIRTLILAEIPRRSHRGWMTQMLIDLIDALGRKPNSVEVLYLEITADDPTSALPQTADHGPSFRKIPGGRRVHVQTVNPYIGETETVLKDYIASGGKWAGQVRFIYPNEKIWGPSSRRRAHKPVAVIASRQDMQGPVRDEKQEVLVLEPRDRSAKRTRWFHIPWGRREEPEVLAADEEPEGTMDDSGVGMGEAEWESADFGVFEDDSAEA